MKLKSVWLCIALLSCCLMVVKGYEDIQTLDDDDFAEFEQFESEDEIPVIRLRENDDNIPSQKKEPLKADDPFDEVIEVEEDVLVEDEENEFEHFQDTEEFEGFQDKAQGPSEQPKITISQVPIKVRTDLHAYWLEGIFITALIIYATVFFVGRSKNSSIAINFLDNHKNLLEENFTLVGEANPDVKCSEGERGWQKEAENSYTLWCSGRTSCEGMLINLKLTKRQDLYHVLLGLVKPTPDTLQLRIELGKDEVDPFVLCIAQKKVAARLAKELWDLSLFCPERRPGDKHGLPASLGVLSECAEATSSLLDTRVCLALAQYHKFVQYIHISDYYCGPKQVEESPQTKPPEIERLMIVSFSLGPDGGGDEVRPLLMLVFYLLEKLKRIRLSKEAIKKCEMRRQRVAELWQRGAHAARQEQAAARREEKRKQEKERILAEDDPEKQRRWELKEQKRQLKRKTPKMKQLKVKAL